MIAREGRRLASARLVTQRRNPETRRYVTLDDPDVVVQVLTPAGAVQEIIVDPDDALRVASELVNAVRQRLGGRVL